VPSQRYKLTIAYRGTRYHGWQQQPALPTYKGEKQKEFVPEAEREDEEPEFHPAPGVGPAPGAEVDYIPTVQGELARAIGEVVGHPVDVVGSSRTDAGVHAKGQVVHFDTDKVQIPQEGLRRAVNHRLPGDILIRSIEPAPETFDAIASARTKRYQFLIWNHPDRPLFFSDLAWHRWHYLDVPKIAEAARHFVGEHDFASFARPGHGREHTVRTIHACAGSYVKMRSARPWYRPSNVEARSSHVAVTAYSSSISSVMMPAIASVSPRAIRRWSCSLASPQPWSSKTPR